MEHFQEVPDINRLIISPLYLREGLEFAKNQGYNNLCIPIPGGPLFKCYPGPFSNVRYNITPKRDKFVLGKKAILNQVKLIEFILK